MVHPVTTLMNSAASNPQQQTKILTEMVQTIAKLLRMSSPQLESLESTERSGESEKSQNILDQVFDLGHESPTAINIGM